MNRTLISPSILSADFAKLGVEVERLQLAGADWIHVDVMDGHFVPNLTIGPQVVKAVRPYSQLPFDVHLMISDPLKYAASFAEAGADSITFHLEAVEDVWGAIDHVRSLGKRVGISISPDTAPEGLMPYLGEIDLALVMTVYPGFGGQSYLPACTEKIVMLAQAAQAANPELVIQVDGGINPETAALAKQAGANCLVAGSAVFSAPDLRARIEQLRTA